MPLDGATETFMYEYYLFYTMLCCKFVDLVVVLDKAVTASIVVF